MRLQHMCHSVTAALLVSAMQPLVLEALLATFASQPGEQWTTEMHAAWTEACEAIVSLMVAGEASSAALSSAWFYGSQDMLLCF